MASFASEHGTVLPAFFRALFEFAMVWIGMAASASAVRKFERKNLVRAACESRFMAFRTGNRHVASRQRVDRSLMLRDSEDRAMKIRDGVACFAAIFIGLGGKLPVVRIFVAIKASRKLHGVPRFPTRGDVTFGAFHFRMHACERIFRSRVFRHSKQGWLPTFQGVAFRAVAFLGAIRELPAVRVWFVAIGTLRKRKLFFEITIQVASDATHGLMFSNQRVLCLGMVKRKILRNFLPARGCVAMLASFLELAMMWIDMAIRAGGKFHVLETCRAASDVRLVAFFARHLPVQPR